MASNTTIYVYDINLLKISVSAVLMIMTTDKRLKNFFTIIFFNLIMQ
jgi:hypothetical protein